MLDGEDKFFGTFPIQSGDKFEIQNAGEGVLDLRGGLNHTSLLAQEDVKEEPNPYRKENPNKAMFWMTDTPAETQVEGGAPVIIMGDKPSKLTLEDSDSTIIVGNAKSSIDLGDGEEMIVAATTNIPVVLTDFNVQEDQIRYGESVTRYAFETLDDQNVALNFFEGDQQVGQMIIEGTTATALLNEATIKRITDHEKQALMNGYRPAIEIQPDDNGLITGFDPDFHSLQYNQIFEGFTTSKITYQDNQTNVTLYRRRTDETLATFSIEGEHNPRKLPLFDSGHKIEIEEARYDKNNKNVEVWAVDDGNGNYYTDRRNNTHRGFGILGGQTFRVMPS